MSVSKDKNENRFWKTKEKRVKRYYVKTSELTTKERKLTEKDNTRESEKILEY